MAEINETNKEEDGEESTVSAGQQGAGAASVALGFLRVISWRRLLAPAVTVALVAVVVSFTATLVPGGGSDNDQGGTVQADSGSVVPTNKWVNFYGLENTIDGQPLQVGLVITAYDPQGVLCGEFEVEEAGRYGVMAVYGDDPLTDADEGAVFGDRIEFRVNGVQAVASGPDEAAWTVMGDLRHVDLTVSTQ